jgi:hypothetical protein
MMLEDMDMDVHDEEEKQQETQQKDEQQAPPPHQSWYSTITSFIDHVNRVSHIPCIAYQQTSKTTAVVPIINVKVIRK